MFYMLVYFSVMPAALIISMVLNFKKEKFLSLVVFAAAWFMVLVVSPNWFCKTYNSLMFILYAYLAYLNRNNRKKSKIAKN